MRILWILKLTKLYDDTYVYSKGGKKVSRLLQYVSNAKRKDISSIVPKRAISTIAGKLTVTLRHYIADKKPIICYVVVGTIVSRGRSIATSHPRTLLFSSTPPVIEDNRDVSRLLRVRIPLFLSALLFFRHNIVDFYTRPTLFETLRNDTRYILSGESSVIKELTISW